MAEFLVKRAVVLSLSSSSRGEYLEWLAPWASASVFARLASLVAGILASLGKEPIVLLGEGDLQLIFLFLTLAFTSIFRSIQCIKFLRFAGVLGFLKREWACS